MVQIIRSGGTPREVWLVENNPLAARYLEGSLGKIHLTWRGSYEKALLRASVARHSPSVLILSVGEAPIFENGMLRSLRHLLADTRILVIGRANSDEEMCRLLLMGAAGVLDFDSVSTQLARATQALFNGRTWIKPRILRMFPAFAANAHDVRPSGLTALTPREKTVLDLLQRRLADKEIAATLDTTQRTVKFHLQNLYRKLEVHDRHSAADIAKKVSTAQFSDPTRGLGGLVRSPVKGKTKFDDRMDRIA